MSHGVITLRNDRIQRGFMEEGAINFIRRKGLTVIVRGAGMGDIDLIKGDVHVSARTALSCCHASSPVTYSGIHRIGSSASGTSCSIKATS